MRRPYRDPIHHTVVVLGAAFLAACVAASPPPASRPGTEAVVPDRHDPLSAPWSVDAGSGSVAQEVRLEASLVSRVDSVERRDTIRTVVSAEWSRIRGDGALRLAGLLTSFRVSADSTEPVTPAGLLLPLPFSAVEGAGTFQARVTAPDAGGCGPDAAAISVLRELFVTPPRRLEPGTAWRDSSSHVICRDSIALTVSSTREFRVVGAERQDGQVVVLLERRSWTTMHGEGRQFGEPLSIVADGEGLAQLAVRLSGGFIVAGTGESELRMTMRGRRRSQELTQRTRMEIVTP